MRVLALADICNPEWPSLPIVGYQYAKALAEHVDLTVVTQIRNKENIDKAGLGKAKVVYLDTERVAAPLSKLATVLRGGDTMGWTVQVAMDYPSYVYFERTAHKAFKAALSRGEFDIVHRLTPMSPALPSPMAAKSPVPFVLGPLNGNLPWPKIFSGEQRREREMLSKLRSAYRWLPYHRSTYAASRAILAAFDHTVADVPPSALARTINFPEVGIDPKLFARPVRTQRERRTVLFAGRLVPLKLVDIIVGAFAASDILRKHRLVIVGDGPERAALEQMIKEHDLADCVELRGQRPQPEVAALMQEAEIFAFPSIRELGAGVVIEAMACGMVCVAVGYGGPATLVGPDRGVVVPLGEKAFIAQRFQAELEQLVGDPDRCERLGDAAYAHAMKHYTWDAKARKTLAIYEWALGKRAERPDFWRE